MQQKQSYYKNSYTLENWVYCFCGDFEWQTHYVWGHFHNRPQDSGGGGGGGKKILNL
jgi:hypothetical protein